MKRIVGIVPILTLALLTAGAAPAEAQSRTEYLRRMALLLDWVHRGVGWVESNFEDPGLGRAAQKIAERYVDVAQNLIPPAELRMIHPHLVLVVENAERACYFAGVGSLREFRHHMRVVREEQRILTELMRAGRIEPMRF